MFKSLIVVFAIIAAAFALPAAETGARQERAAVYSTYGAYPYAAYPYGASAYSAPVVSSYSAFPYNAGYGYYGYPSVRYV